MNKQIKKRKKKEKNNSKSLYYCRLSKDIDDEINRCRKYQVKNK